MIMVVVVVVVVSEKMVAFRLKKTDFSSGDCMYNSLSNPVQTFVRTDLNLGLFGNVSINYARPGFGSHVKLQVSFLRPSIS
jgi:hypothetical protein